MPYKDFSSFSNITPAFGNPEQDPNYGYTALPATPCEKNDAFDDEFFLLYRRSEYAAQIELLCAKIFKMLMGYGPEMEIVRDGDKFFIASRKINAFKEGYSDYSDKYQYKNSTGVAATRIIYYFLCGTDSHTGNFGMQKIGQNERAFRIDMPEAFDLEMLNETLQLSSLQKIPYIAEKQFEGDDPMYLPVSYVTSPAFQDEKMAMIQRIASMPFCQFEKTLRETVTVDHLSHIEAMKNFMIRMMQADESQRMEIEAAFAQTDREQNSLETMIKLFKIRHERWQLLVSENPKIEQDLSLSDPRAFWAEMNKYMDNPDSSESCEVPHEIAFEEEEQQQQQATDSRDRFFSAQANLSKEKPTSPTLQNSF